MKRARKSACWFFTARSGIRIDRFDVWSEAGDWKEQAQALPAQSHTARCVRKKAAAHFAGAWGVPNKQSERPAGTERWIAIFVKNIVIHCLQRL